MNMCFYDFDDCETMFESCVLEDIKEDKCCICGEENIGYGNNPVPAKSNGRCCDKCNSKYVLPYRYYLIKNNMAKRIYKNF